MRGSGAVRHGFLCVLSFLAAAADPEPPVVLGGKALAAGNLDEALRMADRALEDDVGDAAAWDLRARWAEAAGNRDERATSLHRLLALSRSRGAPKAERDALRDRLLAADPVAADLLALSDRFVRRLVELADACEKDKRPHAAVNLHRQVLALDPDRVESRAAIERISALPDPSLAETARPRDLLADVSRDWIADFDRKHADWEKKGELKRDHYVTCTDAGYEVMVRAAEAMEQMNSFYREFFDCRDKSMPRILLHIFRNRDEYLKLGIGPPIEWSGGHFTGGAVELYVGDGGIQDSMGTLFHEAAHQFVAATTNASGWLNEGLASFFEGCRIQPNGAVLMNEPADHRLFPLADRMEAGWMESATDGMNKEDPSKSNPTKAPTFRVVLENQYEWGPAWYAPTWGVVYFLYDFQDPRDGRFVYRAAFREFAGASGGRTGKGAVKNFEELVLGHPSRPTPGLPAADAGPALPRTVEELDVLWKEWILALRDERSGRRKVERPWLAWARHAVKRGEAAVAAEQFERALAAAPRDPDVLGDFADHLARAGKNPDRAVKLWLQALRVLEAADPPDTARIAAVEKSLEKADPNRRALSRLQAELGDRSLSLVDRYLEQGMFLVAADLAGRLAADLNIPGMLARYETALRRAPRSPAFFSRAYNGRDLAGWTGGNHVFRANGDVIAADMGEYRAGSFAYASLGLDRVVSGDFSLEAEVLVQSGVGAYAGILCGRKGPTAYHALVLTPSVPKERSPDGVAHKAYLDLTSFYDAGNYQVLRHEAVGDAPGGWHRVRIDVAGPLLDVWFDGNFVTTQEFSDSSVLAGGFGLFTGVGSASFRNVRFLARAAGDPAARVEREVRMARVFTAGRALNGSWLKQVPPFPAAVRWVAEPRVSWDEREGGPQVLVFWSMKQNDIVPLHEWLSSLAKEHAESGLSVVSICQPDDPEKVKAYIAAKPFPGAVGVDSYATRESKFGATFEAYFVGEKNNLPHAVLLDVDRRVAWEGSPGFEMNKPWKAGDGSFLDDALKTLLERRRVKEVRAWRAAWKERGGAAAARGDFTAIAPLLEEAARLPGAGLPDLERASAANRAFARILADPEPSAADLATDGRAPAACLLLEWSKVVKKPLDARKAPKLSLLGGPGNAVNVAWKKALALAKEKGAMIDSADSAKALAASIAALEGAFPRELAARLEAAKDPAAAQAVAADAPLAPARWLLSEWGL